MRYRTPLLGLVYVPPPTPFSFTISVNSYAPNIRSLAVAAGWNSTDPLICNITAAVVGALDVGNTPFVGGLTLNVSAGTRIGGAVNGGDAITTRTFVTINNLGTISGAGGRGGNGQTVTNFRVGNTNSTSTAAGGDGGSGQGVTTSATIQNAASGEAGTRRNLADVTTGLSGWAQGGAGGTGGAWGSYGLKGSGYTKSGNATIINTNSAAAGGSPGNAVNGDSYVTWSALGTIVGARIN